MRTKEKYMQEMITALKGLTSSEAAMQSVKNVEASLTKDTVDVLAKIAQGGKESASISVERLLNAADDLVANGVSSFKEGGLIPKSTNISGISNKLKAADLQMGKTTIGRMFSKGFLKSKDTITFGGGLLGLAFTANSIIQAIKAAKEAPKGEKKATFMHVLSEHYVGLLLFQPSINLLYKAGGNKYRGMSVEARNALKELIQTTNANGNLTKEAYKIAQLQKKLLLKGVDKTKVAELAGKSFDEAKTLFQSLKNSGTKLKFWEKPLKALGTLLDTGLDTIKKPSSSSLGKIGNKLKGFMGGFGRFLIIFMVLQPLLQKPVTKLCHKIFGKPKAYLAKQEGNSSKKAVENKNISPNTGNAAPGETNLLKLFAPKIQQQTVSNPTMQFVDNNPSDIKMQTPTNIEPQQIPSPTPSGAASLQPLNTQSPSEQIPLLNIFKKDDSKKSTTAYIPSIEVDYSNMSQQDEELSKYVDQFIAAKDKELKQLSK